MPRNPSNPKKSTRPDSAQAVPVDELASETRVHHAIVEAVLAHQLPPGTRLVEARLCEAFGVSRSVLRRVFVRLAGERVITLEHNRGATVAQPGREEMREVFEARQLIEGGVLRALGTRTGVPDFARMRALVAEEKAAFDAGSWSTWVRLSGEYHLHLARMLGNREVETILRGLIARTTLMKALYHSHASNVCSFDEHNQILDALEAGDDARSCHLMHAHLHAAQSKLQRDNAPEAVDLLALFGQA